MLIFLLVNIYTKDVKYEYTPMHQKGISKPGGGLILNPYRQITGGNQAIYMLIITQLTKLMW